VKLPDVLTGGRLRLKNNVRIYHDQTIALSLPTIRSVAVPGIHTGCGNGHVCAGSDDRKGQEVSR